MIKNDLIMMTTTTSQPVTAGGIIPLTTISRRRGCIFSSTVANSIIAGKAGYYLVKGSVTFTAPAAGVATIRLFKNGVAVEGVSASETITTATTEVRTVPISGIVRVFCNEGDSTFTLIASDIAITVSNVELNFIYLG